jgi:hypothetical protein
MRCARSVEVKVLPKIGNHVVAASGDETSELYNCLADFLTEAIPALRHVNKETRCPEALGLKPLPQFATIEEAIKALQPRAVPTQAAINEELQKLALEDDCSSSDDESGLNPNQTALAKDSSEYFGFVG